MKKATSIFILGWNVYVGNAPLAVRSALAKLLKEHKPHVVGLMEAVRLFGSLDGLGYKVVQFKPKSRRRGATSNNADIAILVRDDVELIAPLTRRMKQFWYGPKHHKLQDPRVNRGVRVRIDGQVWKIIVGHGPFGKSQVLEWNTKLIAWVNATVLRRPVIIIVDANETKADFQKNVGDAAGLDVERGPDSYIDLIASKNAKIVNIQSLGRGISDHPANLYEVAPI